MDTTDADILRVLKRDGRASYVSIADEIGSSEATVRARVKRMEEDGTIQAYTVRVRGTAVRAMVEVALETNVGTGKISETVHSFGGVREVWEVTGDYDLVVIADVDSTDELNDLVENIRAIPGTMSTRTRVILHEKY